MLLSPKAMFQSCTVAACSFLVWSSLALGQSDAENEAKLEALKATMEALRKELESVKGSRNDLLQDLEKSEKEASQLNQRAKELEEQLENSQDTLDDLQTERTQLQDKKQSEQQHVGEYINAAYKLGQQSQLRLLLNQEDPARVSRNLKYYERFIDARSEKIESFVATIERLNTIEPEIQFQKSQLKQQVRSLQRKRDDLAKVHSRRQATLAELNTNIKSQDQRLSAMKLDRKNLEKLLSQVSNYIQDIKIDARQASFSSMKGKLPWPTSGKLAKRFGSSRVSNKLKWEGWLIRSNEGSPVRAVHHGHVVFSDYLRGQGMLVIVDHGKGFLSLYAHNQTLYKEIGEWVDQGEVIASVGDSGGQDDHALYFELRHKGKPINPKHWLSKSA